MGSDWYDSNPMRSELGPPLPEPPEDDQVVVLSGIRWQDYDALCRTREHAPGPRLSYLDGTLEIVSPGWSHEHVKSVLRRLLEAFGEERDVVVNTFGSTTYRKKLENAGVEPDECFCFGRWKELPDLAIEIVETSGGVEKLEIYRRLAIREVWFVIGCEIYAYRLRRGIHRRIRKSVALPQVDLVELGSLLTKSDRDDQPATVKEYRRRLRRTRRRR